MNLHRSIVSLAAVSFLVFWANASAFAHAELRRATPTAGGAVSAAPTEVVLNFSEQLEASFSSIVVRDSVGKRIDKADARVDPGDHTSVRVTLQPISKGTYIVVWRALTADTHRTEGAFLFRVGE